MRLAVSILSAALFAGCAQIRTDVKLVDTEEGTRHINRTVVGTRTYSATVAIDGINLVATVSSKEMCEQAEVPIIRRKRITTKTEVQGTYGVASEYVAGLGGIALGGLLLANPGNACNSTDQSGMTTMTDSGTCTGLGWLTMAAGAVVLGVAIADSARLRDEEKDLGTHEGEYDAQTRECHAGPLMGKRVNLELANGMLSIPGRTSSDGEVSFSMGDAWEDTLPSPGGPASIRIGTDSIALTISSEQVRELAGSLLNDPQSRLARDAVDAVAQRCAKSVEQAQKAPQIKPDSDDATVAETRAVWAKARRTCASSWTADFQARRDVIDKSATENRIGAVVLALTQNNLDRVDELLAGDSALAASLKDDQDVLRLLKEPIGRATNALASNGTDIADAQRRLCRARRIFVAIRGTEDWDKLKAEVAANSVIRTGGSATNVIRLMDAARCE